MNLQPRRVHYVAVFLLSCSLLMLEIVFARILSVALFSHYAFVAVSLAMFGLGLSGLFVYLRPQHFTADRLDAHLVAYTWRFGLSAALSVVAFLHFQVVQQLSFTGFLTLGLAYVVLAIPFFFGGVCLSLLMTHFSSRIGRIYGADLVGASLGCIGVVAAMSLLPAPQVAAYVAVAVAATAIAIALASAPRRLAIPVATLAATLAIAVLGHTTDLLRMRYVKTWSIYYAKAEAWNAFSRIAIFPSPINAAQQVPLKGAYPWYASSEYPSAMNIDIDGTAWTAMVAFDGDFQKLDFLRHTVLYLGHHLRPNGDVLIIGTGGGRDLLAASAFRQHSVLGIEINPLMRHIVQDVYGDYSGRPYTLPGTEVIFDEARSRLSTLERRFDVIQLSLIDTFSLNAAGSFVFSENYLYTKEGFQEYSRHLTDQGLLSVSRYFTPAYPLEVLRVAAMVRAAWQAEGVENPAAHVVVLGQQNTATVLAKRTPFSAAELDQLESLAQPDNMKFYYRPDGGEDSLQDLTSVLTTDDLPGYLSAYPYLIDPPTDDRPFFFNFLRGRLADAELANRDKDPFQFLRKWHEALLLLYLLIAVVTALAAAFFTAPLLALRRRARVRVSVAVPLLSYFACLGYGFMMIEVPLLQHFVLLLGYPVYALAVVLFSLLLFSGIGSLLSSRFTSAPRAALERVLVAIVAVGGAYVFLVPGVITAMIGTSIWLRVLTTALALAPIGVLLGMAYPLGITLLRAVGPDLVPWAWALNGALSVVASVLAIFIGSRIGFSAAFFSGVVAYAAALVAMRIALAASGAAAAIEELARTGTVIAS